jgi:phosphoglycolate phosphatase
MKYDSIIFDIDGTLWNASDTTAKAWNQGLLKLGIEKTITRDQVESVTGNPNEICIEILLPGLREKHPTLQATLDEYETKLIKSEGREFYQGVIDGIKELSTKRRIFLVSNCQDWYMDLFLELSGIKENITAHDCHGKSGKTKHEMLTEMKNNYSLKNTVYIGDTQGDEEAARQAEIEFIHAAYGFGTLKNNTSKAHSFPELLNLLK